MTAFVHFEPKLQSSFYSVVAIVIISNNIMLRLVELNSLVEYRIFQAACRAASD